LHNKPLDCGASEVYASGPACEEEEEEEEEEVISYSRKILHDAVLKDDA